MTAILTDQHIQKCFADIVTQANISCIVETGTYHGDSTKEFAKLVPHVITIEKNEFNFQIAGQNLEVGIFAKRVILVFGDSAEFFTNMEYRPEMRQIDAGNDLFVLDAHWETDWPLLAELQGINRMRREAGIKTVVFIDDFFVPNRSNFAGCYGGLRYPDSEGKESQLIPCGYNPPFAEELDKFPTFYYPHYSDNSIGYGIASDFELDLGSKFRRVR